MQALLPGNPADEFSNNAPFNAMSTIIEILSQSSDPVLVCSEDGIVEWINENGQKALGLTAGSTLEKAFPKESISELLSVLHFSVLTVKIRLQPPFKSGERSVIVLETSSGGPDDQKFILFLKSFRSDNRATEEREELLSSVAHDLKNPLGAIFGYTDALLDTPAGEGLSPRQRRVIERIRQTASRSIDLVKNYQHITKLLQTEPDVIEQALDLNTIVRSVLAYSWREQPGGPQLSMKLSKEKVPSRVHPSQAERVIANLVQNAVKYAAPESTITISTWIDGPHACFSTKNPGVELKQDELQSIFEKHHRGSTSHSVSGSGIGLYIVQKILEAIEAQISVSSSKEEGVVFTVRFPGE